MPSHVHLIISSRDKPLQDIVRDLKSHTSVQLKKLIREHTQESRREWMVWMMERAGKKNSNNSNWQFWQQHNHPLEITNNKMYAETVLYIHQNPVASGFVYEADQWIYSSAKCYEKNNGMIILAEC